LRGGCEQRREKILSEGREWRRRRGDGREIVSARLLMQSPWVGENDERERERIRKMEWVSELKCLNLELRVDLEGIF
jgi:hypothetical protein